MSSSKVEKYQNIFLALCLTVSASIVFIQPAQAAVTSVTATGSSPSVCNQSGSNLGNNSGDVTAERLSGGDCVVIFKTSGITYSWKTPYNVSSISVLVVGAGGGGGGGGFSNLNSAGGGGGGGGGGGQVSTTSISGITANQSFSAVVGAGGAAGAWGGRNGASWGGGNGRDGSASSFGGTTASGGKAGFGGGAWGIETSPATATCENSRPIAIDNYTVYYIDGIGGAGGASGNGAHAGVLPFCSTTKPPGQGGAGASGSGNGSQPTRLTSAVGTPNSAGIGTPNSLTGSSVEYGTGGLGGVGGLNNPASASGTTGFRAGMGGAGGTGSKANDNSTQGALGGAGAAGLVVVRYTPDTTAPSFANASTFDVNENIATTTTAVLIMTNESSTIEISPTGDYTKFTISYTDSTTASIKFATSPNFEIPSDSGADNAYSLTITALDINGNSNSQVISIQILDVNENPGLSGTPYKGQVVTITVTVGAQGKVRFLANGKRISNCLARSTSGSNPNISASCIWKPTVQGKVSLTATLTPTNNSLPTETSVPTVVQVLKRTNNRG